MKKYTKKLAALALAALMVLSLAACGGNGGGSGGGEVTGIYLSRPSSAIRICGPSTTTT